MIALKINIAMNGKKIGDIIKLETDENNNILDNFWARRLEDSKIDNCVEVMPEKNITKGDK